LASYDGLGINLFPFCSNALGIFHFILDQN
jgi:hypothetical protein